MDGWTPEDCSGTKQRKRGARLQPCKLTLTIAALVFILLYSAPVTESFLFVLPRTNFARSVWTTRTFISTSTRMHSDNNKKSIQIRKNLDKEFASIAVPAFFQQAAVPFADLVDAIFLRKLGPGALGGVGIARASQASVSKLYNTPLSKTTISLIASKYGNARQDNATISDIEDLSAAVSTGLLLALAVGLLQLFLFTALAGNILSAMGVSKTSDMAASATSYMRARAAGLPAATVWLVSNGVFRGLGDTMTPLLCSILLNVISLILNPIFMFTFDLGASGAALSTVVAQYTALVPLLWVLQKRVPLNISNIIPAFFDSLQQYLKAGTYLLGRTAARVSVFTYFSRQSALLGSVAASAYSVTFQIGFQITLACEAIAVAVQTLLSRELSSTAHSKDTQSFIISHLIQRSVLLGITVTGSLVMITFIFRTNIVAFMAKSRDIQNLALDAFPAFLTTQLVKGLSFPMNGIVMGAMDWKFSMVSMFVAQAVCLMALRLQSGPPTVSQIWIGWTAFLGTQALCGFLRYASKTGVWKKLKV